MNDKNLNFLAVFSIIFGMIFGILFYFAMLIFDPIPFLLALSAGAFCAGALFVCLVINEKWTDKKYNKAEKAIQSPVWMKINANFETENGIKNGNIYFCDGGVVFISLDKKPYSMDEIGIKDIAGYETDNIITMSIKVSDGRIYKFKTDRLKEIMEGLKDKGWI